MPKIIDIKDHLQESESVDQGRDAEVVDLVAIIEEKMGIVRRAASLAILASVSPRVFKGLDYLEAAQMMALNIEKFKWILKGELPDFTDVENIKVGSITMLKALWDFVAEDCRGELLMEFFFAPKKLEERYRNYRWFIEEMNLRWENVAD